MLQGVGTSDLELRERVDGAKGVQAALAEDFLEFGGGLGSIVELAENARLSGRDDGGCGSRMVCGRAYDEVFRCERRS